MTLNFVEKMFTIGGAGTPPLQFFKRGFSFGGSGSTPSYRNVVISGVGSLTLVNAKENGLNYVKAFGACEQKDNVLPSGYTRLDFVTCNNNSRIDTDIIGDETTVIKARFRVPELQNMYVYACQSSNNTKGITAYITPTVGNWRYGDQTTTLGFEANKWYETIQSASGISVNGTLYPYGEVNDFETPYTIILGTSHSSTGGYGTAYFRGDLGEFSIEKGGVIVANYIPCKNDTTNKYGFYDTISETFKFSETANAFTAGETLPTPHNPVPIKCNNGEIKVNQQGQIYADGTTETITITGKNLFNKNSTENVEGWWNVQNQIVGQPLKTLGSSVSVNTSHPIRVYPNQTYTLVGLAGTSPSFLYLDKDMNFVSGFANSNSKTKTITVPDDDSIMYLRFPYSPTSVDTVQMEYGDTATDYAPYFEGGTATCENLFAVGEIKDIQSILNGDVTRKVGIKVFDGTEAWSIQNTYNFSITKASIGTNTTVLPNYSLRMQSNYFQTANYASKNNSVWSGNTYINFRAVETFTTVENWKAWLAEQYNSGNPVILLFPLANTTTQTVTTQTLSIQEGTDIVTATGSIDDLAIEVSYKAGVEVTITEVENAQLDDTVTVTIH